MAAKLSTGARKLVDSAGYPTTHYRESWGKIAPGLGIRQAWYRNPKGKLKVAGGTVRMDFTLRADPKFQGFLRRLDRMPGVIKKEVALALRKITREEIIPRLKKNIPLSDRRKPHLRATAQIMEANLKRVVVGVGSTRAWYASVVHAGGVNRHRRRSPFTGKPTGSARAVPFYPRTFRQVWPRLNDRLIKEMYDIMGYLGTGIMRRRFG